MKTIYSIASAFTLAAAVYACSPAQNTPITQAKTAAEQCTENTLFPRKGHDHNADQSAMIIMGQGKYPLLSIADPDDANLRVTFRRYPLFTGVTEGAEVVLATRANGGIDKDMIVLSHAPVSGHGLRYALKAQRAAEKCMVQNGYTPPTL